MKRSLPIFSGLSGPFVIMLFLLLIYRNVPAQPQITIEQLHLFNMSAPILFSSVGMVNLTYVPDTNDHYLNIVAQDINSQPKWIVQNLYLPDLSWIPSQQTISSRFDFGMLGVPPGQPVPALNIFLTVTESILPQMPIAPNFFPVQVDTISDDSQGDFTPVPLTTPLLDPVPPPVFMPGDTVNQLEYRGCRVPNIDLNDSLYPSSPTYAGDKNACVPASAANSLKWLDDVNPKITIPDDLRTVMMELSGLMQRAAGGGTFIEQFIRGKLDYIQAHGLPINVKFQSQTLTGNIASSDSMTYARNDNTGNYPTWEWMKAQVDSGEDVETCYYWWDGSEWRGHAIVITGIEESPGGRKNIKYKHDVKQRGSGGTKQEDDRIVVDNLGRMVLAKRGAYIGHVVAESPGEPLPVELSLFNYKIQNGNVHLYWQTESEINNRGFEIFRDGQKLIFIEGKGTSVQPQDYSYIDFAPGNGILLYELLQIDFDGSAIKVGTLKIKPDTHLEFYLMQNYPNPFNPHTIIEYKTGSDNNVKLEIYNSLGQKVKTLINQHQTAGVKSIVWDGKDNFGNSLPSGVYIIKLRSGNFVQSRISLLLK